MIWVLLLILLLVLLGGWQILYYVAIGLLVYLLIRALAG